MTGNDGQDIRVLGWKGRKISYEGQKIQVQLTESEGRLWGFACIFIFGRWGLRGDFRKGRGQRWVWGASLGTAWFPSIPYYYYTYIVRSINSCSSVFEKESHLMDYSSPNEIKERKKIYREWGWQIWLVAWSIDTNGYYSIDRVIEIMLVLKKKWELIKNNEQTVYGQINAGNEILIFLCVLMIGLIWNNTNHTLPHQFNNNIFCGINLQKNRIAMNNWKE